MGRNKSENQEHQKQLVGLEIDHQDSIDTTGPTHAKIDACTPELAAECLLAANII